MKDKSDPSASGTSTRAARRGARGAVGNATASPAAPTDAREEAAAPIDEVVAGAGAETPEPSDGNER